MAAHMDGTVEEYKNGNRTSSTSDAGGGSRFGDRAFKWLTLAHGAVRFCADCADWL